MERISQTEAARNATQLENVREQKKAQTFLLSEVSGAGGAGFLVGYMSAKNPDLDAGIGPGKRLKLDHVVAIGGLYLGRKRTRSGALARGAGLGAVYKLAEGYGRRAGTTA